MHRSLCTLALCAPFALAATGALAAANTAPMNRAELKVCMDKQADLDKRRASYAREVKTVNATGEAVSAEGNALQADQGKLDKTNAAAVKAFGQRVAAYDKKTEAYNVRVVELQKNNSELESLQASHANDCAQRTFLSSDRDALLAEHATAASAPKR